MSANFLSICFIKLFHTTHTGIILNRFVYRSFGLYRFSHFDFCPGLFWKLLGSNGSSHLGSDRVGSLIDDFEQFCASFLLMDSQEHHPFVAHYNQNYFVSHYFASRSSGRYEDSWSEFKFLIAYFLAAVALVLLSTKYCLRWWNLVFTGYLSRDRNRCFINSLLLCRFPRNIPILFSASRNSIRIEHLRIEQPRDRLSKFECLRKALVSFVTRVDYGVMLSVSLGMQIILP